jgi:hypothetical protein
MLHREEYDDAGAEVQAPPCSLRCANGASGSLLQGVGRQAGGKQVFPQTVFDDIPARVCIRYFRATHQDCRDLLPAALQKRAGGVQSPADIVLSDAVNVCRASEIGEVKASYVLYSTDVRASYALRCCSKAGEKNLRAPTWSAGNINSHGSICSCLA